MNTSSKSYQEFLTSAVRLTLKCGRKTTVTILPSLEERSRRGEEDNYTLCYQQSICGTLFSQYSLHGVLEDNIEQRIIDEYRSFANKVQDICPSLETSQNHASLLLIPPENFEVRKTLLQSINLR